MHTTQTANQLSGRATGALFFAGFGALWLLLASYLRGQLHAATLAGLLLGLATLTLGALTLLRLARRWPRVADDPAMSRTFNRVNAAQWIAVFVVAFALNRFHLDAYTPSAVTILVGLHFFPLARLFHYGPHYVTGAALTAWGVASAAWVPVDHLQGTTALGTGAMLWISATVTLLLALIAARRAQPAAD